MDNLKSSVKSSFRTEMIAAGLYVVLAEQYGEKNPILGNRLRKASEEEHMHGRLFRQYYRNAYDAEVGNEKIWISIGKIAGNLTRPVPLEKKLKSLSTKEAEAVKMIESKITGCKEPSYLKILKRILPDEVSHAGIYSEVFDKDGLLKL